MKKIISKIKKAAATLHRCWRRLQVFVERGTPTMPVKQEEATCGHCGRVFKGNYCPRCGQHRDAGKGKPHFLKTFREAYPQLSGNFLRTVIHLALRPGYMIRDYFRGHRVIYQSPVSTFLLAISIMALCSDIFHIDNSDEPSGGGVVIEKLEHEVMGELKKAANNDAQVRKAYDRWNVSRRMAGHRRLRAVLVDVKHRLTSNVSFTLFALFPMLSSMSYMVFRKRMFYGRRLTLMEHYVIFAYLYAFFSLTNNLGSIQLFYMAWAYRGIYRLSWVKSAGYAVLVLTLAMAVCIVFILALILVMVSPVAYYYLMLPS